MPSRSAANVLPPEEGERCYEVSTVVDINERRRASQWEDVARARDYQESRERFNNADWLPDPDGFYYVKIPRDRSDDDALPAWLLPLVTAGVLVAMLGFYWASNGGRP
jgi:hypothetical protein